MVYGVWIRDVITFAVYAAEKRKFQQMAGQAKRYSHLTVCPRVTMAVDGDDDAIVA